MADRQVIYEVRVELAPRIVKDYDQWLRAHVEAMLRIPGFLNARVLREETTAADGAAAAVRTVQYELESRSALDEYLQHHAAGMRADAVARFGADMRATRRILSPADAVNAEPAEQRYCSNCASRLSGQYCYVCGQRDQSRMISVWELLRDFLGDLFELDSRLWRTVFPLLFRPGKLTLEYLRGRRVHYSPPLRMYLVLSLVFFLLIGLQGLQGPIVLDGNALPGPGNVAALPPEIRTELESLPAEVRAQFPEDLRRQLEDIAGQGDGGDADAAGPVPEAGANEHPDTVPAGPPPGAGHPAQTGNPLAGFCEGEMELSLGSPALTARFEPRLREACRRIIADGGRAFLRQLLENIPAMMFIFLPMMALVMKALYIGSRRYYVEHLLFLVHYHSFVFLILTLAILLAKLPGLAPGTPLSGAVDFAVVLYMPFYLFRGMRVVYGQGRLFTAVKFAALGLVYFIGLVIITLFGAVFTALSL